MLSDRIVTGTSAPPRTHTAARAPEPAPSPAPEPSRTAPAPRRPKVETPPLAHHDSSAPKRDATSGSTQLGERRRPTSEFVGQHGGPGAGVGVGVGAGVGVGTDRPSGTKPAATVKDPITDPAESRALRRQQRQLGRAFTPRAGAADRTRAASYFADHHTYVDPQSGTRYRAHYDDATGSLKLTRRGVTIASSSIPGGADPRRDPSGAFESPGLPLDARGPLEDDGSSGLGGIGIGALAATLGARVEDALNGHSGARDGEAADHGRRPAPDASAPPAPVDLAAAGTTEWNHASATMDETILLAFEGARQTTRDMHATGSDGSLVAVHEVIDQDAAGSVTGGTVARRAVVPGPNGAGESYVTVEHYGDGGWLASRSRQDRVRTVDGATTTSAGVVAFEHGAPTGMRERVEYTFGTVRAVEEATTTYVDGTRATRTIHQSAVDRGDHSLFAFGPELGGATITVGYDDAGEVDSVEGPEAVDGMTALDRMVADVPTATGRTFRFSQVRARPTTSEGVALPGLVSDSGFAVPMRGIPVFQEHALIGARGEDSEQLQDLRSQLAAAPDAMRAKILSIDLLDGHNPQDEIWAQRYDRPDFTSGATGGNGHMTFYVGNETEGAFFHELGHITGTDGGAPDDQAWAAAIRADDGIDDRILPKGAEVVANDEHVLLDGTRGVTDYADDSYRASGSEGEDWADSVMLWLASRRTGGLVTVRTADGRERTYDFADLYPGRAAILEAYYAPK